MKKIVREFHFSLQELHTVEEIARTFGLTETTAGILFARGLDDGEKVKRFLHPSRGNLLSPFLMSGMKEAHELLSRAREEGWRVAVFGDYDADGIGASAILYRALQRFGIEAYLYVPEREEGYGMSVAAIDAIFDEFLPDLIVTVDCGISNYREVEYIKEQGAYVIVTDHHELPERLPDCICINPKLQDDYPYDNLCGAGVALKLAVALIGEEAYDLLDLCALSTVADSVPLTGENRDIVAEGLRLMQTELRPVFEALLGKPTELSAQTLAFTLAPRVNAAGRMGDARAALRLFTSDDGAEIAELAAKLNSYNMERQRLCDDLYELARAQIAAQGAYKNIVMLVGENWHPGLIGIVAARIAEEYSRPAILFVRKGNMLRGSARSIDGVNIFEALRNCSAYIEEFGGHSQAAGVNVKEECFEALARALDEYVAAHYAREDFIPVIGVSEEIDGAFPRTLAHELELLEPFGVGNRRPVFSVSLGRTNAAPIKPFSPHLALSGTGMDFMYFGGYADLKLLRSDVPKHAVFECNLSSFRGKESVKGFIRALVYDGSIGGEEESFENFVRSLAAKPASCELLPASELNDRIRALDEGCAYGLCVVAQEKESLKRFPAAGGLPKEIFRLTSGNVRNVLLFSPDLDCDLSAYRDIVFLENPAALPQRTGKARLYAAEDICGGAQLSGLDLSREAMVAEFTALRRAEGIETGTSYAEAARSLGGNGWAQTIFALAVFEELGLISLEGGRLGIIRGTKTELTNSAIYSAALRLHDMR